MRLLLDPHTLILWTSRGLVAQAQVEGLTIISNDTQLDGYAVSPVWKPPTKTVRCAQFPNRC